MRDDAKAPLRFLKAVLLQSVSEHYFQGKSAFEKAGVRLILLCLWGTKKMNLRFRQTDSNSRIG
ncbi:MAG: hypothetical protein ACOYJY_04085, partial [Acutalibacteraceae bacterium]